MLLFYIRHGDPIYEPDSLTSLGKRQAEALSKRLAMFGIDEIYASCSNRAVETAKPTAELTGKPIKILDFCDEQIAWQEFTCTDKDDGKLKWIYQIDDYKRLFVSDEMCRMGARWYEHTALENTGCASGVKRIVDNTYGFLRGLGYEHDDCLHTFKAAEHSEKRVALFAHEGFGMVFLSILTDIPYPIFCTHFGLEHSSMTVIRFSGVDNIIPQILQLSNDSHLYRYGLPTVYNNELRF